MAHYDEYTDVGYYYSHILNRKFGVNITLILYACTHLWVSYTQVSEQGKEEEREKEHQEGKNSGIYIYGRNMCRTTYYIVVAHSGSNSRLDNEKNTHNSNF